MTPQPDTAPDLDLGREAELAARRAAVMEWNRLPPTRQAAVEFDRLVAKHRRRIGRERGRE